MIFDLSLSVSAGSLPFAKLYGSLWSFLPIGSDSAESMKKVTPGVRLFPKQPSLPRKPSHAEKHQPPGRRSYSHSDYCVVPASTLNVKLVIVIKGKMDAYPSSLCTTTYVRFGDSLGGREM